MKIAFTICSANYLPFAKALGDTLIKHNNDYTFSIVLLDKLPSTDLSFFASHTILPVQHLQLPQFKEMNSKYNIFELSCALKPFALEYFIEKNPNAEVVIYFDSDILLFNKLTSCEEALKNHSIVITPHINTPLNEDGFLPNEEIILKAGLYNAGFIAVNNSQNTLDFLSWWKEILLVKCFNNQQKGLFVDQLWLSYVPLFFPSTHVFKNLGYNVAYWNLHERDLSGSTTYLINKHTKLVFFHFSGYEIYNPDFISKYQNRFNFKSKPLFLPLFEEYKNRVLANKYVEYKDIQPAFGFVNEVIPQKKKSFIKKIFGKRLEN